MRENIITALIFMGALTALVMFYYGIRSVVEELWQTVREARGYERYRPFHPYDWKRNGL